MKKEKTTYEKMLTSFIDNCIIKLKMTKDQFTRTQNGGKFESEITEAMWQGFKLKSKSEKGHCVVARAKYAGVPIFNNPSIVHSTVADAVIEVDELTKKFPGGKFVVYQRLDKTLKCFNKPTITPTVIDFLLQSKM
jgi:hypothetical protein